MMDKVCPACGLCVANCPVEQAGGASFLRRIIEGAEASAWLCASCWLCQMVCPEELDIHALMIQARRREPAPVSYSESFRRVLETGCALPIPDDLDAVRREWDLSPVTLIPRATLRRLLDEDDDDDE